MLKPILRLAILLACSFPVCAQHIGARDYASPKWVFATAETTTRLVPLSAPEGSAANLTWAICSKPPKVPKVHLISDANGANRYETADNLTPGEHCLLVDSASHDAMFLWGDAPDQAIQRDVCIKGFPEQAEAFAGRKVRTCSLIGGFGTGHVELVEYVPQLQEQGLAALIVDNQRTLAPEDLQHWSVLLPAGSRGWIEGAFHPEQFRYLFTIVPADRAPENDVQFVGIQWDGPKGSDLILYRPVGNTLKPVLINHSRATQTLTAQN